MTEAESKAWENLMTLRIPKALCDFFAFSESQLNELLFTQLALAHGAAAEVKHDVTERLIDSDPKFKDAVELAGANLCLWLQDACLRESVATCGVFQATSDLLFATLLTEAEKDRERIFGSEPRVRLLFSTEEARRRLFLSMMAALALAIRARGDHGKLLATLFGVKRTLLGSWKPVRP